jgi:hypothetical protein
MGMFYSSYAINWLQDYSLLFFILLLYISHEYALSDVGGVCLQIPMSSVYTTH